MPAKHKFLCFVFFLNRTRQGDRRALRQAFTNPRRFSSKYPIYPHEGALFAHFPALAAAFSHRRLTVRTSPSILRPWKKGTVEYAADAEPDRFRLSRRVRSIMRTVVPGAPLVLPAKVIFPPHRRNHRLDLFAHLARTAGTNRLLQSVRITYSMQTPAHRCGLCRYPKSQFSKKS